ncbi:hypothetical protein [Rhodopila sp.]|uniref:hypothetical protein n=1 Tax=Rhodopila sp. TaxID=2480087 RepID=UPI003D1529CA
MTEIHPTQDQPADPLMEFIIGLLTPLLMTGGMTDPGLARLAAAQAIRSYKARGVEQLLTVAEIAGFALASLDTLRLSMAHDLSVEMKLKLRGNANALNHTSQRATAALEKQRSHVVPPIESDPAESQVVELDDAPSEAELLASLADARAAVQQAQAQPAASTGKSAAERQHRLVWANAMAEVAAECSADLAHLTPAQRREQLIWFGALTETARVLAEGDAAMPAPSAAQSPRRH